MRFVDDEPGPFDDHGQRCLKTLVQESQGFYGDFDEVGAVTVEGDTAYVSTVFAEKSVAFSVTFGNNGMVSAFSSLDEGQ